MSPLVAMNSKLLAATVSTTKTEILQQSPKKDTVKEQMDLKAEKEERKEKLAYKDS